MALDAAGGDTSEPVVMGKHVDLAKSVARLNRGLSARRARMLAGVTPQAACSSGGTEVTDGTTTTYSDCVTVFGTAKFYVDGTVSYSESASGFSAVTGSSSDPYILRIYQSVGGVDQLLGELVMQVSITGTYAATTTCDSESVPTTTSIAMSGSISNKENDEDGTAVEDFESSFNNLAITVVSSDLDSVTCEPAVIDVTMSGSSSSTDSLDSSNSIAMSVDSGTPLSIHWEDMGTFAEVDVSGTVTIDSSCFDGTLTIATTTPIQVPDSEDDACPVAGVVKVTGSMTGTVTYNSNGSVSVDEGSNGTVDRTLASCDEAETCS